MELSPYLKQNWSKIEVEHLKMILDLAEKLLKETVETSLGYTRKAAWMCGIFSSLLIVLVGGLVAKEIPDKFLFSAYLLLINVFIVLVFTFRSQKMYSIDIPGKRPGSLLDDDFFEPFHEFEDMGTLAYKNIILDICMDYHAGIEENNRLNAGRLKNLEMARKLIYVIPFSAIAGYLLFLIL
jgi:hypothetical protein